MTARIMTARIDTNPDSASASQAEVNADDQPGGRLGRDPQVTPHAAARIQHDLAGNIPRVEPGAVAERRAVFVRADDPEPIPLEPVSRLGAGLIRR